MSRIGQWVTGSDPKKYGKLFSDVMVKAWPKPPARGQQVGEKELLRHVLRWTPFVSFFTIVGKTQCSSYCLVCLTVYVFVCYLAYVLYMSMWTGSMVCLSYSCLVSCLSLICDPNLPSLNQT